MSGCRKIGDLLGAYIYGDLSPEEMRRVRLHVDGCAACGSELESRTQAIAIVPAGLPKLSDEERQRIAWTVRGAVRAESERQGFRLSLPVLVRTAAFAAVVAGAFAAGSIYQSNHTPVKVIVKYVPAEEKPVQKSSYEEKTALGGAPTISPVTGVDPALFGSYEESMRNLIDPPFRRWPNQGSRGSIGDQPTGEESVAPDADEPKPWDWPDALNGENSSPSPFALPGAPEPGNDSANGGTEPSTNQANPPTH